MLVLRKSGERGHTRTGWLDSYHTFSFGEYRDPDHVRFGTLRVINEDMIAGGGGFAPHPHNDMEIVTYMLSGALAHKDSLGNGSTIRVGEIQRMSAGTGIVHSEFNVSREEPAHLLQIWIVPSQNGLQPSYEQKAIAAGAVANKFARIAAPDPGESEVRLVQDAEIWAAKLDPGREADHVLKPGRRAWLHVARGEVELSGETLAAGDAAAVTDEPSLGVRAKTPAEILLFDLA